MKGKKKSPNLLLKRPSLEDQSKPDSNGQKRSKVTTDKGIKSPNKLMLCKSLDSQEDFVQANVNERRRNSGKDE